MNVETERFSLLDWISLAGATWFGSGLLPKMPGTWGTIAAVPLIALLVYTLNNFYYAVAVLVIALLAIPLASRAAQLYRNHPRLARLNPHSKQVFDNPALQSMIKDESRQKEDPGLIVIDEVAGYAVALLFVQPSISALLIAFVFFRLFDIVKIQPARLVENIGGGAGIVLDDIVAGIYACFITHSLIWMYSLFNLPSLP